MLNTAEAQLGPHAPCPISLELVDDLDPLVEDTPETRARLDWIRQRYTEHCAVCPDCKRVQDAWNQLQAEKAAFNPWSFKEILKNILVGEAIWWSAYLASKVYRDRDIR